MKKMIFTVFMSLSALMARGQQQLSYSYDAAGNRTNRTLVVSAQNLSGDVQQQPSPLYVDSLDWKQLAIRAGSGDSTLSVTVSGYEPSSRGTYSILDRKGTLLSSKDLSGDITLLKLDALPTRSYTLHIHINRRSSIWKLIKL